MKNTKKPLKVKNDKNISQDELLEIRRECMLTLLFDLAGQIKTDRQEIVPEHKIKLTKGNNITEWVMNEINKCILHEFCFTIQEVVTQYVMSEMNDCLRQGEWKELLNDCSRGYTALKTTNGENEFIELKDFIAKKVSEELWENPVF